MEDQPGGATDITFENRLEALTTQTAGVTIEEFSAFLKNTPERKMAIKHLNQIVNFASEQVGVWEAAYSFSPADSPDVGAKNESEQWEELWKTWSALLLEQVPDLMDKVNRRHRLIVAGHSVATSLQCKRGKPLQRIAAAVLSRLAIGLGRLGIADIPERLYALSLYPKGSVGRGKL
jgi:hypothetical protein